VKEFAAADLTFDTANPRPDLIEAILRLIDQSAATARVLDHVPAMTALDDPATVQE
jgi:hypothetical protein